MSVGYFTMAFVLVAVVIFCNVMFSGKELPLLNDFSIVLLPFDSMSVNFFLNYFYQLLVTIFATLLFFLYFPLTLVFMNHSCWGIDSLILHVGRIGQTALIDNNKELTAEKRNEMRKEFIDKQLESIVKMTYSVFEWKESVQRLLQVNFFLEFSLLSFIFCMCIYSLISSPFTSIFIVLLILNVLPQLFLSCWMGSRVVTRIDNLSVALYDCNWYTLTVSQQKSVKMILMMTQKMKGYHGIFKEVNLKTFQKV